MLDDAIQLMHMVSMFCMPGSMHLPLLGERGDACIVDAVMLSILLICKFLAAEAPCCLRVLLHHFYDMIVIESVDSIRRDSPDTPIHAKS